MLSLPWRPFKLTRSRSPCAGKSWRVSVLASRVVSTENLNTGFEPYFYYCWIFSGLIFNYCLNSVHYYEDRFHIHFVIRCVHMWFSYTYSHLVSTILLRTTYRQPALKTPSTTASLEWMSLNRKLVLVTQMKIQLIFLKLIVLKEFG